MSFAKRKLGWQQIRRSSLLASGSTKIPQSQSSTSLVAPGGTEPNHGAGHASSSGDPSSTTQSSTVNVILFGETGVGKSSVINLIARKNIARVSSDVNGCTMESTPYSISFDAMNFTIFDTIGLEEPEMGVNGYLKAIEKAFELITSLEAAGGIHLLLFCMRGGRITATAQSNYRMFYECLCDRKVPIALVFTGLEREVDMENWWKRNVNHIEHYGIKSKGHACITAVHDGTPDELDKFAKSQEKIRDLIKSCALKSAAALPEPHSLFARFAKRMMGFIKKRSDPGRKKLLRTLTQRCNLAQDVAEKIVDMMEKSDTEPNENETEPAEENDGERANLEESVVAGDAPQYDTSPGPQGTVPPQPPAIEQPENGGGKHTPNLEVRPAQTEENVAAENTPIHDTLPNLQDTIPPQRSISRSTEQPGSRVGEPRPSLEIGPVQRVEHVALENPPEHSTSLDHQDASSSQHSANWGTRQVADRRSERRPTLEMRPVQRVENVPEHDTLLDHQDTSPPRRSIDRGTAQVANRKGEREPNLEVRPAQRVENAPGHNTLLDHQDPSSPQRFASQGTEQAVNREGKPQSSVAMRPALRQESASMENVLGHGTSSRYQGGIQLQPSVNGGSEQGGNGEGVVAGATPKESRTMKEVRSQENSSNHPNSDQSVPFPSTATEHTGNGEGKGGSNLPSFPSKGADAKESGVVKTAPKHDYLSSHQGKVQNQFPKGVEQAGNSEGQGGSGQAVVSRVTPKEDNRVTKTLPKQDDLSSLYSDAQPPPSTGGGTKQAGRWEDGRGPNPVVTATQMEESGAAARASKYNSSSYHGSSQPQPSANGGIGQAGNREGLGEDRLPGAFPTESPAAEKASKNNNLANYHSSPAPSTLSSGLVYSKATEKSASGRGHNRASKV